MKRRFSIIAVTTMLTLCVASQIALASAAAAYQDEFTSAPLQSFWTFSTGTGANEGSYSLTANSGYLRLTATVGAALAPTSNYNAPRVLQPVTGNFEATTYVTSSFSEDGNRAGLLIWKDANNFIRLEKWGTGSAQVYAVISGSGTSSKVSTPVSTNLYLKLEKVGSTVNGYYSTDGSSWTLIKATTFTSSDPLEVGLFTINVGTVNFSPDFDYFRVTPYSILSVLPEYPVGVFGATAAIAGAYVFFKARGRVKPVTF